MEKNALGYLIEISKSSGGKLFLKESLKRHNTIHIGGTAAAWYEPSGIDDLAKVVVFLNENNIKYYVLGRGSNVLLPDGEVDCVFINLSSDYFNTRKFDGEFITCASGDKLASIVSECCLKGLSGFEKLVGIPGTIGGALRMNSSYLASISDFLVSVKILDMNGKILNLEKKYLDFGYRKSSFKEGWIIIEATLKLEKGDSKELMSRLGANFQKKINTQPLNEKTLGCIFKNPDGSGLMSGDLIEKSGLKGISEGDAAVSRKHANFIVNNGNATAKNVTTLIDIIISEVKKNFSIVLEPEIKLF